MRGWGGSGGGGGGGYGYDSTREWAQPPQTPSRVLGPSLRLPDQKSFHFDFSSQQSPDTEEGGQARSSEKSNLSLT